MELNKFEKVCCLIIDTHANPSIPQLVECGFTEGVAVEMLIRMASRPAHVLVNNAVRMLRSYGVVTYMGRDIDTYYEEVAPV